MNKIFVRLFKATIKETFFSNFGHFCVCSYICLLFRIGILIFNIDSNRLILIDAIFQLIPVSDLKFDIWSSNYMF